MYIQQVHVYNVLAGLLTVIMVIMQLTAWIDMRSCSAVTKLYALSTVMCTVTSIDIDLQVWIH